MPITYFNNRNLGKAAAIFGLATALILPQSAFSAEGSVAVNVDNFVRAETAANFDKMLALVNGKVNTLFHFRQPMPLDAQSVIRSNRDTLYSGAIVDISQGATLTIPETNGRYVSVMVVNEDHYINKMYNGPGSYKLTMNDFDTPYVSVTVRTLIDSSDPEDVKQVKAIQDGIVLQAKSANPYTHPQYDQASYEAAYKAVIELSRFVPDTNRMFGKKDDVGEVRHLLGTAMGYGGLPEEEAYYLNIEPKLPVGAYQLTVKDVPVDAFWSISLYNKEGYFQENKYHAYSVNNITGTPNKDGSFTVHFGGDPKSANYLHIMQGWNYIVRFYLPRKDILEGTWAFPKVTKI
ncbi:MAG: DUF1214 domain-containing protein [Oleispira sp.]|nr:DUF1214 domain-containing protein [Oleispira sp.]MBL4880009.1 DUF1214 domain-containing protein [Oleispira sp.]